MEQGRPSLHTPELAEEICSRIASGESLRHICESDDKFPAVSTICGWVLDNREGFTEQYTHARRIQAELLADELFSIADDGKNDTYEDDEGRTRTDHDVIARSRLRVDTRKWYLSKVLPKIYGDRTIHAGDPENPIDLVVHRIAAGE